MARHHPTGHLMLYSLSYFLYDFYVNALKSCPGDVFVQKSTSKSANLKPQDVMQLDFFHNVS